MSHQIDELYAVYDEACPVARKAHTCDACEETIPRGHRYTRVAIVFEGRGETVKRCLRCQAIHQHLRKIGGGDCGEAYREHWGKEPPAEIAALAFATAEELQR